MKKPLVATISKFPPYMSGHSFESMNQGRALYEMTGYKHYELTYHPDMYDKSTNFNNSPQLIKKSEKYIYVQRVKPSNVSNTKVFDGELTKAFIGQLINLIQEKKVNVLSTFYLDPHAYIANQAKLYAQNVLSKKIITVHKAVGSDILNSVGNHLKDGQGKFLLLQLLEADLMFAVSKYTKEKILEYAKKLLPADSVNELNKKLEVLYAPFDNEYFATRDEKVIKDLKRRYKIKPSQKVISYFGRLFPEKGVEDLIAAYSNLKNDFSDICLIIGGQGVEMPRLKRLVKDLKLKDVVFTGGVSDKEKRAIMQLSTLGVIPTKPIKNFIETLCISALEYQASGTPLLTTKVGGVPEAAGEHSLYAKHSNPADLEKKMRIVLNGQINRSEIINAGLEHVDLFNYLKITRKFLERVAQKRELKKPLRATISPDFWLTPGLVKPYGRRYKV